MNKIIEFILYPSALGLDIFGPLEVFNTATGTLKADRQKSCGYSFRFTAAKKGPVQLGSGPEIVANATFKEKSSADTLLIPGGVDVESAIDSGVTPSQYRLHFISQERDPANHLENLQNKTT
jgi:transcriptional regulator GlxA family with amidase domain